MSSEKTVLYIEDNPENRLLVRRILIAAGFNVLEADSAVNALETLRRQKPHLIIMDINLPEIDGYSLTRQIKNTPGMGDVPIVAMTANVMKGDRERTLEAGCDGYIQKPIDVDNLPAQIAYYLAK